MPPTGTLQSHTSQNLSEGGDVAGGGAADGGGPTTMGDGRRRRHRHRRRRRCHRRRRHRHRHRRRGGDLEEPRRGRGRGVRGVGVPRGPRARGAGRRRAVGRRRLLGVRPRRLSVHDAPEHRAGSPRLFLRGGGVDDEEPNEFRRELPLRNEVHLPLPLLVLGEPRAFFLRVRLRQRCRRLRLRGGFSLGRRDRDGEPARFGAIVDVAEELLRLPEPHPALDLEAGRKEIGQARALTPDDGRAPTRRAEALERHRAAPGAPPEDGEPRSEPPRRPRRRPARRPRQRLSSGRTPRRRSHPPPAASPPPPRPPAVPPRERCPRQGPLLLLLLRRRRARGSIFPVALLPRRVPSAASSSDSDRTRVGGERLEARHRGGRLGRLRVAVVSPPGPGPSSPSRAGLDPSGLADAGGCASVASSSSGKLTLRGALFRDGARRESTRRPPPSGTAAPTATGSPRARRRGSRVRPRPRRAPPRLRP